MEFVFLGDTGHFSNNYKHFIQNLKDENVILLGDNFYPTGITNENLVNFKNIWKNKNNNKYMILGNHEYSGDSLYTYINNDNWIMPDFCHMIETPHIDIILIDTTQICPYAFDFSGINYLLEKINVNRPGVITKKIMEKKLNNKFDTIYNSHYETMLNLFKKNPNKKKIVCGHYHLESPGFYGINSNLKNILTPLFKKYNVISYICGHEHLIEHREINHNNYTFQQFISGSTDPRHFYLTNKNSKFVSSVPSFLKLTITNKELQFEVITINNLILYEYKYNLN